MWTTPHASIRELGSSLATTRSITGSGPRGTKLSALTESKRGGGGTLVPCAPLSSPEPEQIASHQEQQQLDPET